ncbi:MAG: type II toxin-antitoxin system RelE/ParE family toxin [Lachnospiraceae bacterium]|nr:type II toxin-antitoxin system RelE/ParE family toxin [Lachnospiraceae bacterium]
MRVCYANVKLAKQCTGLKEATKLFGGNKTLAISLLARINAMEQAETIKDIIVMPQFHFHNLQGKMNGLFAIDVKTRRDQWRLILQPLDENEQPFDPCHIDEIASIVRIVEVREVSPHYE